MMHLQAVASNVMQTVLHAKDPPRKCACHANPHLQRSILLPLIACFNVLTISLTTLQAFVFHAIRHVKPASTRLAYPVYPVLMVYIIGKDLATKVVH